MLSSSLASLGAALLVLMLALDPITQQSISYSLNLRHDPSGSATVAYSRYYTAAELGADGPFINIKIMCPANTSLETPGTGDVLAQGALSQGLTSQGILQPVQPVCSTGNCTFPAYNTLGLCAAVVDVSDRLNASCDITSLEERLCNVALNGVFPSASMQVNSFNLFMPAVNTNDPPHEAAPNNTFFPTINNVFANVSLPAAVVYAYYSPNWITGNGLSNESTNANAFVAYEFSLAYCVQTLQTDVTEGIAVTSLVDIQTEFENTTTAMPYMRYNDALFYITSQPDIYLMMTSMFNGAWSRFALGTGYQQYVSLDSTIGVAAMRVAAAAEGLAGLERVWQNVATSMTNE